MVEKLKIFLRDKIVLRIEKLHSIHFMCYIYVWNRWKKKIKSGAQPEMFRGRGGFVKLRHFDKHFIKKSRKKVPPGKILKFFLLDTIKTTF